MNLFEEKHKMIVNTKPKNEYNYLLNLLFWIYDVFLNIVHKKTI